MAVFRGGLHSPAGSPWSSRRWAFGVVRLIRGGADRLVAPASASDRDLVAGSLARSHFACSGAAASTPDSRCRARRGFRGGAQPSAPRRKWSLRQAWRPRRTSTGAGRGAGGAKNLLTAPAIPRRDVFRFL